MDPAVKARALEILETIGRDLEDDTERWEGATLTGPNVAAMLGEIRGTIHGLTGVVAKIVKAL